MKPESQGGSDPAERPLLRHEVDVVVRVLDDGVAPAEAAREHGVTVDLIEAWCERFIRTASAVLSQAPGPEPSARDARIRRLRHELADLIAGPEAPHTPPRPRRRPPEESPWSVEGL